MRRCLTVAWGFILLLTAFPSGAQAQNKVLLVHSYHQGYAWTDSITRGVELALKDSGIQLEVFYLDTKRRTDPEWKIKSGRLALEKVDLFQPDVVIAADDNAQEYFGRELAGRKKPQLVFCGVNDAPARYGYPAVNVTGILERPDLNGTLDLLKKIDRRVKKVVFIGDNSETTAAMFAYLKGLKTAGVQVLAFEQAGTFAEWQSLVAKYQPKVDAIGFGMYHTVRKSGENQSLNPKRVMSWTVEHNRLPTFTFFDFGVADGLLCGLVESGEEHGVGSGRIAREIISGGRTAGSFPITTAHKSVSMVNLSAAEKLGIRIPAGVRSTVDRLVTGFDTDGRVTLSALTGLVEEHIGGVRNVLRTLAGTEQVAGGDWERMKDILTEFNRNNVDGLVWFARPDGSYYAAGRGLTGMNLMDRPYFPRVMSGQTVAGELVVSRATGRKSAVVAVPVRRDGKVIGALGASLYLDALNSLIAGRLDLPDNLIFYALNSDGLTALNSSPDLIFLYPSRQGIESLSNATGEMLSRDSGVVFYEFRGGWRTVLFRKSTLTGWTFALGTVRESAPVYGAQVRDEMPRVLAELQAAIGASLEKMDTALKQSAVELSAIGLEGPAARQVLVRLYRSGPYAIDCAAVDPEGKMGPIEPAEYRRLEGADISRQPQVVRLRQTGKPVFSTVLRSVEGFDAVDLEYPVIAASGQDLGSVSMLIRPEFFLADIIAPAIQGLPVEVWLMQPDGRIIYDADTTEIGRMIFDDPMYRDFSSLLALARKIAAEQIGSGRYEFLDLGLKTRVRKEARWATVGLHGTEWRLVVVRKN